jgi:hypothetical protein
LSQSRAVAALVAVLIASVLTVPSAMAATPPKQCRYLSGKVALHPFPNDAFTKRTGSTPTKRRVNISRRCTPANKAGVRIATTDQNRMDGFSPGSQLILKVPGLATARAFRRSGLAPITNIAASLKKNAPVVVLDAKTRKRVAHWAELDFTATTASKRMLLIHPATNLREGRRYVVIVRGLKKANGRRIGPAAGVAKAVKRNRRVRAMLRLARRAKVSSKNLHQVWDFTVASERSIQSRMLTIRDNAFAKLGDRNLADSKVTGSSPQFTVSAVENYTPAQNPQLLRRVSGTFQVPCYLTSAACGPGGRFNLAPNGLPAQRAGSFQTANFVCLIPRSAAGASGRASLYGHGLLGDASEATKGKHVHLMGQEHNITFCATDWSGFSSADLPNTLGVLNDLSKFPETADRIQQGFLNFLYLGRLMRHPQGLAANPAFQVGGHPAFSTSALYYDGNSQGGILGGALAAMAPDYRRAALGVPGMNFSILLTRSSNWATYRLIFDPAYKDQATHPIAMSLIQMLWDRAEGNGWSAHMTSDPPPNTPTHNVLMHVARGDHQVAPAAADIMARTIGARTNRNPLAPGAAQDKIPLYGIRRIGSFPFAGSAIIYWEPGGGLARVPLQPLDNRPTHLGVDPHGDPRYTVAARRQKSEFLRPGGRVIDVCGGGFCQAEKDPARP